MGQIQKHNNSELRKRTGATSNVVKAIESKKVKDCSDQEILKSLKYLFYFVGLKEFPDKIETSVLLDYIKTNYRFYSLLDFKNAFQMGSKGEIICEMDHFQTFSPTYFSKILRAYSEYRERIVKEYMIKKQRQQQLENQNKEVTLEQKERARKEFFDNLVKPMFKTYKETERLFLGYISINDLYESLRDDYGLIQLNDSEQTRIKDEVKDEFENDVKLSRTKGENKTKKQVWRELCRRKAIELSFDKIEEL